MVVVSVVVTVAVAMVVAAGMFGAVAGFGKVFLSQQKLYTHSDKLPHGFVPSTC